MKSLQHIAKVFRLW